MDGAIFDDHKSDDSDEGNMLNNLSDMDMDVDPVKRIEEEKDVDPMFALGGS